MAATTNVRAEAEKRADDALAHLGDEAFTPGFVRAAMISLFEQGVEFGATTLMDEALNSGDGSYRP